MCKKQALRDLVTERLVAAADEVFALIEQAFAEYEEELLRLKVTKLQEQQEQQEKDVQTSIQNTEAEQTLCDSLHLPLSPLKSEDNIDEPSFFQQDPTEENRQESFVERCAAKKTSGSLELSPAHNEKTHSSSDTDDLEDWGASAGRTTETNGGKFIPSRKHRKRTKRKHELNESGVSIKREREEEELESYIHSGPANDMVSAEDMAQSSANAYSTSWMSFLSHNPQSTDTVALMQEMLAKQDVLLQQQAQIFTLLSASQSEPLECSLNYKDLPLRDHQNLTGMEARLHDQDYKTKLMDITIQIGNSLPELKRCTDCCTDFHCPFCSPKHFQPTMLSRVKCHLKSHFHRAVQHEEFTIHRCGRPCRTELHYHCLHCTLTVLRKEDFVKHLRGHWKQQSQSRTTYTPPATTKPCVELH